MLLPLANMLALNVLIVGPAVLFGVALVLTVGLCVANVKLKVEQDPRIDQVEAATPGANCGGCGYAGCSAYAKAVVEGKAPVNGCTVGGNEVAEAIAKIMGVTFDVEVQTRPVVHCAAHADQRTGQKPYHGVQTCAAANLIPGIQNCAYGCLGYGDCATACQFNAVKLDNGLPLFDYTKCTSCGACVKACPRNLVELIPFKNESMLVVACASQDPPKVVRNICPVGCIGCGACEKQSDVFGVKGNCARIDYDKYTDIESLRDAFEKCPAKAMIVFGPHGRIPVKDAYANPPVEQAV